MSDIQPNPDKLTLVLLGKTGSGKSTLGNELVENRVFEVGGGPVSVTECCSDSEGVCAGRHLSVVDTPGTMDVKNPQRAIAEIRRAIDTCPDGIDAFIVVVNWSARFTEEEASAIEEAVNVFGSECYKRTIVVFSHVDQNTRADFKNNLRQVRAEVPRLDKLLNKLCNRYCPMDNGQLQCTSEMKQQQLGKLIGLCDTVSSSNPVRYGRMELEKEQRRQEEEKKRQEEEKKKLEEEKNGLEEHRMRQEEEKNRLVKENKILEEENMKLEDTRKKWKDAAQFQVASSQQGPQGTPQGPSWYEKLQMASNLASAVGHVSNIAGLALQANSGKLLPVPVSNIQSEVLSLQRMHSMSSALDLALIRPVKFCDQMRLPTINKQLARRQFPWL